MTRQVSFDGENQSDVLTRMRVRSGKSRTQIAAALDMETDTYRRYENGQTELRVSQVKPFARAYGAPWEDLASELLFVGSDDDAAWRDDDFDMAAYLAPHIPASMLPTLVERHQDESPESQRAVADVYIRLARRAQLRATKTRNRPA